MIKAIICDLDGLLADTERLHMKSYQKTMSSHNFILTEDEYSEHWIRDGKTINEFVKKHGLTQNPTELHKQKIKWYKEMVENELNPIPGVEDFIKKFSLTHKLAVATSSYRKSATIVLNKLDLTGYFRAVVTRDDVTKVKPDPEIFIKTAEMLNLEISECVVLEDAQKGIEAASRGGFKSIAIPNIYTADNDFSKADIVLEKISIIDTNLLNNL